MKNITFILLLSIATNLSFGQLFPTNENSPIFASRTINNKIYFFGGQYNNVASDTIRYFDLTNNSWYKLSFHLPYPIYDHVNASYYNGSFYLSPGFTSGQNNGWGSHNKIIKVDLIQNQATEIASYGSYNKIWNISSVEVDSNIYFSGGHNGSDLSGIYKYNTSTETLANITNMSTGRSSHKLIYGIDGMIYIMGDKQVIEKLNPSTGTIQTMTSQMPSDAVSYMVNPICWHIKSQGLIYFFRNGENNKLYKFDYINDIIDTTGLIINGIFSNQHTSDSNNEYIIYVLEYITNISKYKLTKLDLSVLLNTNSIKHTEISKSIHIYPNPTSSKIILSELPKSNYYNVEIINMIGQTIYLKRVENSLKNNSIELNISEFSDGVYILKLQNSDLETFTGKIIKQ